MNCRNTYYFIDDFNQICKQKNGVQKEFSEILELQNLIEDINEIIDENEQLKQENQEFRKRTKELIAVSLDYPTINLDLIAEAIKSLRELIE